MKRTLFLIFTAMSIAIIVPFVAYGQTTPGSSMLQQTIKKMEDDADRFQGSLDTDLDHSPMNGTPLEDQINQFVDKFEGALDRLKEKYDDQGFAPGLAREALIRGRDIDRFMRKYHTGTRSEADWLQVRRSLQRLAQAYRIPWRW